MTYTFTYTNPNGQSATWGAGQDLELVSVDGLDGYTNLRSSTSAIPRGHGAVPGNHYLAERTPVFRLEAIHCDWDTIEQSRRDFMEAMVPTIATEGTLEWSRPADESRMMYCRPVSVVWPTGADRIGLSTEPVLAFEAADPRHYSTVEQQVSLQPYATTGGVDDPVNDPKDATVSGLEKGATNDGNAAALPVMKFYGPTSGTCTGVQLVNTTTDVTLDVQTNIVAGQILTVDMRAVVAATGDRPFDLSGANRFGSWQQPREPLVLEPGSNLLRFTGDGDTTGMRCVVQWRDTWIS